VISIWFYVSPFQRPLWVCFTVSVIVMGVFWSLVYKYKYKSESPQKTSSYSLFLFLISTLTDDSCGLPAWFNKNLSFRLSFTTWFLATLVLVNGYIGVLISELTSGFEKESVHSFANLSKQQYSYEEIAKEFLWCRMRNCKSRSLEWNKKYELNSNREDCFKSRDFDEREDFRLLSSPTPFTVPDWSNKKTPCSKSVSVSYMASFLYQMSRALLILETSCVDSLYTVQGIITLKSFKVSRLEAHEKLKDTVSHRRNLEQLLFNLIHPSHNGIPQKALNLVQLEGSTCVFKDVNRFETIIEQELVKCQKTAFVDEHNKIVLRHEYLKRKYPKITFYVSERIRAFKRESEFACDKSNPRMYNDLNILISSGIFHRVLSYFENYKYLVRRNDNEGIEDINRSDSDPQLMKLAGRLGTLFILFVLVLCVTMLVLFFEFLLALCLISGWNNRELSQRLTHYLFRLKIQYQSFKPYYLHEIYQNLLRGPIWFNGSCLPLPRLN